MNINRYMKILNYLWNDDLHQTTPCAIDIIAQYNDYTIIVMDARNCIATASFQLDSTTNSMNPDSVLEKSCTLNLTFA